MSLWGSQTLTTSLETSSNCLSATFENKNKIDWQHEMQNIGKFHELGYLHKSDNFVKPCDCQIEHCHRYCIGKEVFINKSLKWPLCGRFMKAAFKRISVAQHRSSWIVIALTVILSMSLVSGCIVWIVLALISDLNVYQKALNSIWAVLVMLFIISVTGRFLEKLLEQVTLEL